MVSRTCDNCLHAELSGNKPPCNICVGLDRWEPVLQPALAEVFAEMRRARELHGDGYMGNLSLIHRYDSAGPERNGHQWEMLRHLRAALAEARAICDSKSPTRLAVLVEEFCEFADEVPRIPNRSREELVQVAAMALAWLGVDPGTDDDR